MLLQFADFYWTILYGMARRKMQFNGNGEKYIF